MRRVKDGHGCGKVVVYSSYELNKRIKKGLVKGDDCYFEDKYGGWLVWGREYEKIYLNS